MTLSHSQYVAVVAHILSKQGRRKDLNAALREANVPRHMLQELKEYFTAPVKITDPTILKEDRAEKIPLCVRPDVSFQEQCFPDFRNFLLDHRRWSRDVVENLAESSIGLVTRLPQPGPTNTFQWRGLVVGHIQSGKTASMAALIARAADQGYRLFIVMSGLYHDLRSQTQTRLDQEITGETDNPHERPIVSHAQGGKWLRLTKSGIEGEIQTGSVSATVLNIEIPKLAVIKKNVRVLDRVYTLLRNSSVDLAKLPALVIDDEADQASINTNANKKDEFGDPIVPSKTNKKINQLLHLLPKCAYVGYTATPFANILIDAEKDDLYPRDFIAVLPEPAGYLGPRQLFGLGMTPSELSPEDPQPAHFNVIRNVTKDDLAELKDPKPEGDVPKLLKDAMLAFILGSCARMLRGQKDQHFSMLVHPSVKTDAHNRYAEVIRNEIAFIQGSLARPRKFKDLAKRAKDMWEQDFLPTTRLLPDGKRRVRKFHEVWEYAKAVVDQLEVKVLNSDSEDILDYDGAPKRYVVVGGARLSRGLTLQGLSVSLFLRESKDYDTLLQMGRWFGYRNGYEDLTRIYVDEQSAEDFADLARIEHEMREDLRKYAKEPDPPSPRQVFPRVRSHHRLAVTSVTKRGAGRRLNASFAGKLGQTVSFPFDEPAWLRENERVIHAWMKNLGRPDKLKSKSEGIYWKDRGPDLVLDLIGQYRFGRHAPVVNLRNLTNYIKFQNNNGELTTWDIAIARGSPKLGPYKWTDRISSYRVKRSLSTKQSIGVLSDPGDLQAWEKDLHRDPTDRKRGVLYLYPIDGGQLRKDAIKRGIKLSIGDVVGLVFQFPESETAATAEYVGQEDDGPT